MQSDSRVQAGGGERVKESALSPFPQESQLAIRQQHDASRLNHVRKLVRKHGLHDYDNADSTGTIAQSSATARTLPAPRVGAWKEDPTSDRQALSSERTVASNLIALLRAIDHDDETAEGSVSHSSSSSAEARKRTLSNHVMLHMRDDSDFEERKQPCIRRATNCDPMRDSDFTVKTQHATNRDDTGQTVEAPLDPANMHVVVQHEITGIHQAMQAAQFKAPSDAPRCSLNIPYRSLNTTMLVRDGDAFHLARVIVDSGAAQTAVSAKWLKRHPQLWDGRITATHRFHGITGEPLHTDGVVRLTLNLAGHLINVWAHVFVDMHVDMLLGASSIIENALVIDGADCTLYPKGLDAHSVPLQYKLTVSDQSGEINLLANGQVCFSQQAKLKSGLLRWQTPVLHELSYDTVVQPSNAALPEAEEKQALLVRPQSLFVGEEQHRWLTTTEAFRKHFPSLEVVDSCYSTRNLMTYMVVINYSNEPITIPAGTVVGQSIRHKARDYVTSNDEGVGRLEFKVHAPKDTTGRPVTEETLRERGLDLSNCRDLGAPGAPLLNDAQRQRLIDQWIEIEQVIAVDPKCPGTSDYMLVRLNTGDHPPQASKPYSIPYAYQELVRKEIEKLLKYNLMMYPSGM